MFDEVQHEHYFYPCTECDHTDDLATSYQQHPEDHAFLYFSGSSGDLLDLLQAHWIPETDY